MKLKIFLFVSLFLLGISIPGLAADTVTEQNTLSDGKVIKVGVSTISPLVMKVDGDYIGYSIDWWEAIAKNADIKFEYVDCKNVEDVLSRIENGELDMGFGGIIQNEAREARVDLGHNFFKSGGRIAVHYDKVEAAEKAQGFGGFMLEVFEFKALRAFSEAIVNPKFIEFLIAYCFFVIIFAHIIWVSERGTNKMGSGSGCIDDKYLKGISESIYFCIVTSSSTGYGDITARKATGRVSVCGLIILGIAFFANLTALLSADYVEDKMNTGVNSLKDLQGQVVVTTQGSEYVRKLKEARVKSIIEVPKADEAFGKLMKKEVYAAVVDNPSVLYYANNEGRGTITPAGDMFSSRYYCFAFPNKSELRDIVSQLQFRMFYNDLHEDLKKKWFGN